MVLIGVRAAVSAFAWPDPVPFNWALDWFDAELAGPESRDRDALRIVPDFDRTRTSVGVRCGDLHPPP
ncbi:hypothetical protein MKK69_11250 [Methylobacterium sp. J-026]|nr:hypothetical protein [Methylobacterium sp. J-026]